MIAEIYKILYETGRCDMAKTRLISSGFEQDNLIQQ
jgi:hypothetical protein